MSTKYKNLLMLLKEMIFLGRLPKLILASFLKITVIPHIQGDEEFSLSEKQKVYPIN